MMRSRFEVVEIPDMWTVSFIVGVAGGEAALLVRVDASNEDEAVRLGFEVARRITSAGLTVDYVECE